MSKFSIDLNGLALPDAIAAVVEAWYEAQNIDSGNSPEPIRHHYALTPKTDFNNYDENSPWERLLREQAFYGCDHEWSLGPRQVKKNVYGAQACLTHVNKRGKTESVLLPYEWCIEHANNISGFVAAVVSWVEDENTTFAKGYRLVKNWHDDEMEKNK